MYKFKIKVIVILVKKIMAYIQNKMIGLSGLSILRFIICGFSAKLPGCLIVLVTAFSVHVYKSIKYR